MKRNPKRECTVDVCTEPYSAKGYCRFHYKRFNLYGDPLYVPVRRGRKPELSNRVLDVLEADGGWLTAEGIALQLDGVMTPAQVKNALYDALEDRTEHRAVGLASSNTRGPYGFEVRAEWRAKP